MLDYISFESIAFGDLQFGTPKFPTAYKTVLQNIFRRHRAFHRDFHHFIVLQLIVNSETSLFLHFVFTTFAH